MRLVDFGESHGSAIGGVIIEVPSGRHLDLGRVQRELDRRRPGNSPLTSPRKEPDIVEFLSGISVDSVTLGTPIGFVIRNVDARSADYSATEGRFRPNHADYTYWGKYGVLDWRGGGRSSARLTACRVVAGAIARQLLEPIGISVKAYISRIGNAALPSPYPENIPDFPDDLMLRQVEEAREANDSVGGVVSCRISGVPAGVGEPLERKLQAVLAGAMMGINAAKGFEYGDGFAAAAMRGSDSLDLMNLDENGRIKVIGNHCGGIQGGISNGNDILFSVAFKPTPSIPRDLPTVNIRGERCMVNARGRHDPCVALRAVPVVEAQTCLVLSEFLVKQ